MLTQNPNSWGTWTHDTQTDELVDPYGDQPVYGMYPSPWRRTTARETSEANQHRSRDAGGGLGHAAYDAEYLTAIPQRPLSAGVADVAMKARVQLG